MRSASQPVSPTVDPDVAATIRLLHRRHGFRRLAIISFIAFLLGYGGYANAVAAGTPPPLWFLVIVMALGGLTIVGAVAAVTDTVLLRRRTPAVRAQAAALAVHHPGRPHALHHPPWHLVTWILGWVGMLLILVVAVVSVSAVPDGDFITSEADILLGDLDVPGLDRPIPFWMSVTQYEYWKHTHLTVDVVPGRGSGFSVEAPEGVRFLIRSRLLTDAELAHFNLA